MILKHLVDKNYGDDRKDRRVGRRKPLGFFAKVICLLYVPFPFTHHELLPKKLIFLPVEILPANRKKNSYNFCIGKKFTWIKLYLLLNFIKIIKLFLKTGNLEERERINDGNKSNQHVYIVNIIYWTFRRHGIQRLHHVAYL